MSGHEVIEERSLEMHPVVARELKSDLEHILRACSGAAGETEFIVIGSQAVLE